MFNKSEETKGKKRKLDERIEFYENKLNKLINKSKLSKDADTNWKEINELQSLYLNARNDLIVLTTCHSESTLSGDSCLLF